MISRAQRGLALLFASTLASPALAHEVAFKSPASGMHFTQGQPVIVFADLGDTFNSLGAIVCPVGQTITNVYGVAGPATCSGGGTPVGWPQFQVLVDNVVQADSVLHLTTIPGTTNFNEQLNPDPIDFNRFSIGGLGLGTHQIIVRGQFPAAPVSDGATVDSTPISIVVDAVPGGKTTLSLSGNLSGSINWNNMIIVGNGHTVTATGAVTIVDSFVTALGDMTTSGITGTATSATITGSTFESTGALNLGINGPATIRNNEFRANNLITFESSNPDASPVITFGGSSGVTKYFQANRTAAGRVVFDNTDNWLIGGDTDADSNIIFGPRGTLYLVNGSSHITVRGNYIHHNYRGDWSQGFNISFTCLYCGAAGGTNILVEHNMIRGGSWPIQNIVGEFRYNLIYGYGHEWLRSGVDGAIVHHNVFAPEGDGGDLNTGVWFYGGETGIQLYNNTFDGGGQDAGPFAGPHVTVNGTSQIATLRNNLFTYSRNQENGSDGDTRIVGDVNTYGYADYNAFYSPDNSNHDNYNITGMSEGVTPGFATHDVSGSGAIGVKDGQLAANPFAGARIFPLSTDVDEAAIWQRTQKLSAVLADFRVHYAPKAGSPIINAGDPQDNDSLGRRTDIGAIDVNGHDLDRFGKFGDEIFANGFE